MSDETEPVNSIPSLLTRLNSGDETAIDDLIAVTQDRLCRLARKLLNQNRALARWETADDVYQNAALRLVRALKEVKPADEADYINLAALQIRREIVDLYRHHFGPTGHATFHSTVPTASDEWGCVTLLYDLIVNSEGGPAEKFDENELRTLVERLDQEHRAVFVLLVFKELDQVEAAKKLNLSVPTIKRRWREAKEQLQNVVGDWEPFRRKRWWTFWRQ